MRMLLALFLLWLPFYPATAQQRLNVQETVDSLQALRDRADTLIKAGDHAGIELLERTERWLAERDVAELARGSVSLQTRIFNTRTTVTRCGSWGSTR